MVRVVETDPLDEAIIRGTVDNPGIRVYTLCKQLGRLQGSVMHRIQILERLGFITVKRGRGHVSLYPGPKVAEAEAV